MSADFHSNELFRSIVQDQTEFICRYRSDGTITFVNDAYCRYFNKSYDELVEKKFQILIPSEDQCKVKKHIASLSKDNPVSTHEHRVILPGGETRWHQWTNRIIFNEKDETMEYQGTGRDITDRKKSESNLYMKSLAFNSSLSADSISTIEGILTYANPSFVQIWGYESVDDVIGRPILDFLASKDKVFEIVEAINTTGKWEGEYVALRKDGSTFIARSSANAVYDEQGKQTALYSSVMDITDRKRIENELQENKDRLSFALHASISGIWDYNIQTDTVFFDENYFKIAGYRPNEFPHNHDEWKKRVHPDDLENTETAIKEYLSGNIKEYASDFRFKRKNGDWMWIQSRGQAVEFDSKGNPVRFIGVHTDISRRKQAEEEHLLHLHFLENMAEVDTILQKSSDVEKMMADVLKVILRIFGADRAWLLYPCDPDAESWSVPMECARQGYAGAFSLGEEISMLPEARDIFREALDKDGVIAIHAKDAESPKKTYDRFSVLSGMHMAVYVRTGKPWMIGMHQCSHHRDWTKEEKNLFHEIGHRISDGLSSLLILQDLSKSEKRYLDLYDNAPAMFVSVDHKSRNVIDCNKMLIENTGYSREEIVGCPILERYHKSCLEEAKKAFKDSLFTGIVKNADLVLKKKDGGMINVILNVTSERNEEGRIVYSRSVWQDITEKKKAERLLKVEKERAEEYLNIVGVMVMGIDSDKKIVLINRRGCEILGYEHEEIIGKNFFQNFLPERMREQVLGVSDKLFRGELEPVEYYENPVLTKSGEERIIAWHNTVIRNEKGEIVGHLSSGEDITERKQMEEELQDSEARYRTLFEKTADAILIIEGDQFVDCNQAAINMLCCQDRDAVFRHHPSELSPKYQPDGSLSYTKANEMIAIAFKKGSHRFEWDHKRSNGEVFPAEVLLTSIPMKGREILHVVWRDITERKKTEEIIRQHREGLEDLVNERTKELKESQDQLLQSEKMASIGQLSAGIAHELNSPLAGLISLIRSYKKGRDRESGEYKDLIDMELASEYMAKIIKDLTTFSRSSVGEREECNCNDIISSTLSFGSYQFREKKINVKKAFEKDLYPIEGDKNQLQQVVLNVLTNAAHSMGEKGALKIVTKNTKSEKGRMVEMSFEDNGGGISQGDLKKIFDPFFTTKRPGKGVGLGLSIVFNIVQNHGGSISVKSELEKGTKMTIVIPVK